jgi:hypothetical protein
MIYLFFFFSGTYQTVTTGFQFSSSIFDVLHSDFLLEHQIIFDLMHFGLHFIQANSIKLCLIQHFEPQALWIHEWLGIIVQESLAQIMQGV